ncbi:MAG: DPP IV N-terminal domain-containing protein [Chloroflexota bacterium]
MMVNLLLRRVAIALIITLGLILSVITLSTYRSSPMVSFVADVDGQTDIYMIDLATRHPINLTDSNFPEWSFAWSNTGALTFTASVNPSQAADELFTMSRLGIAQLIDTPETLYSFGGVWSPDGTTYAYFSSHPRNISDIYTISVPDFESRNLTQTDTLSETNPLWSPIGTELLYRQNGDLYLLDMTTGERQILVNLQSDTIEDPVWSPDGQWIIFYDRQFVDGRTQLIGYRVARDGTQLTQLSLPTSINSPVTWSPDSQQIALITEQQQLTIYDLASDTYTQIDGDTRRFAPSWSRDGQWIAFIQNRHLYVHNLRTQTTTAIVQDGRIKPPLIWYPDS